MLRGDAKPLFGPPLDVNGVPAEVNVEEPGALRFRRGVEGGLCFREPLPDAFFERLDGVHCSHTPFWSSPGFAKSTAPPVAVWISIAPFSPRKVLCARLRKRVTFGCPSTSRRLSACGGYIRPSVCQASGVKGIEVISSSTSFRTVHSRS